MSAEVVTLPVIRVERGEPKNGLRDFQSRLRLLLSIDLDELQEVGLMFNATPEKPHGTWAEWRRFGSDPFRYLIKCDDATAEKIWSIVERRAARK